MFSSCFLSGKIEWLIVWRSLDVYVTLWWCLSLLGLECVLPLLFTTLENEEGEFAEEGYYNSCLFQDQGQDQFQGKPSKCLLLLYLSLSIMHVFTSEVLPKLDYQNYFWCGYYYYNTICFIIMPVVKTWCYQAHSHHMVYLPA